MRHQSFRSLLLAILLAPWLGLACTQRMADQPKYTVYEESSFFPDGTSARPIPSHAISLEAVPADDSPDIRPTRENLQRGRKLYLTFCTPCHGTSGSGDGPVIRHGFSAPPDFRSKRLQETKSERFVEVIRGGFKSMFSYSERVSRDDAWLIALFIKKDLQK